MLSDGLNIFVRWLQRLDLFTMVCIYHLCMTRRYGLVCVRVYACDSGCIHLHIQHSEYRIMVTPPHGVQRFSFHFGLVPYIFALLYILNKWAIKYVKTAGYIIWATSIEYGWFIRIVVILSRINTAANRNHVIKLSE